MQYKTTKLINLFNLSFLCSKIVYNTDRKDRPKKSFADDLAKRDIPPTIPSKSEKSNLLVLANNVLSKNIHITPAFTVESTRATLS